MTILLSQVHCIGLKRDLNDSSHSLHSVTQVLDPMLILMGNVIYDETFPNHMKSRLGSNGKSFPESITLPNHFNGKFVFISVYVENGFDIVGKVLYFLKIRFGQSFHFSVSIYTPVWKILNLSLESHYVLD